MPWNALLAELRPDAPDPQHLSAMARDLFLRASAEQPGLRSTPRTFLRTVLERIDRAGEVESASEIAIAAGCADGDSRAFELFEREFMSAAVSSIARMRLAPAERDEVLQRVRAKLLVPKSGGALPLIASYAGGGKLRSFLRVVATREALGHLRTLRADHDSDEELEDLAAPLIDPSLRELATRSEDAMRRGFELAIQGLSSRDRNMLRLHFLDGVELGAIAQLYRVHRVTASRWLADVRHRIVGFVRTHVQAELGLSESEVDSVVRLARGRLAGSVERILRTPSAENT